MSVMIGSETTTGSDRPVVWKRLRLTPATQTLLFAASIGFLCGFAAIVLRMLVYGMQDWLWATSSMAPETLMEVVWSRRLLLPVLGGVLVGPLVYFLAPETRGDGVGAVMIAVVTRNSVIRTIVAPVKILASALSIATGGSVGREGPIVQIGGAIGSSVGQLFRVRAVQMKTLVGCGVAAGIAAGFNAPMAGTLFALELIVSDFGLTAFTPILVSAVVATAVTHHFSGNVTAFILPEFDVVSVWEMPLYLVLGLVAGLVGYVFSRSIYVAEDLSAKTKVPLWIRPALGGLVVGCIAQGYPHVLGAGYGTILRLFDGAFSLQLLLGLVVLKIIATSATVGSGGSGGVFVPSLFIGAMLGAGFGVVMNHLFPEHTASPAAYALVGMAAVNGACTLAPLSAIVVLLEITGRYNMMLPLMLAVGVASLVSRKLSPESIYTERLRRMGIHSHHGQDVNILRAIPVARAVRHGEAAIADTASFASLIGLALDTRRNVIFTTDDQARFTGVIVLQDLKYILNHPEELMHAYDMVDFRQEIPPIPITQSLDTVVNRFAETGLDCLPVVDAQGKLAGSITMEDIVCHYNRELADRSIAVELGAHIAAHDRCCLLPIGTDTAVAEIDVPRWMVGKKLAELELRLRYNVSVFIVRETANPESHFFTPGADYIFRPGDTLLVAGANKAIRSLQNGGS